MDMKVWNHIIDLKQILDKRDATRGGVYSYSNLSTRTMEVHNPRLYRN